jgi:hypothetical protein
MKPVVQLEWTGYGIASMAALAGVTYAQTKRFANRLSLFADDPSCGLSRLRPQAAYPI